MFLSFDSKDGQWLKFDFYVLSGDFKIKVTSFG